MPKDYFPQTRTLLDDLLRAHFDEQMDEAYRKRMEELDQEPKVTVHQAEVDRTKPRRVKVTVGNAVIDPQPGDDDWIEPPPRDSAAQRKRYAPDPDETLSMLQRRMKGDQRTAHKFLAMGAHDRRV